MNDPDFLDLIAAWHDNSELTPERRRQLMDRLASDETLRRDLAREIQMAGLTREVQAGQPRWLRLEERLGSSLVSPDAAEAENEAELMDSIAKLGKPKKKSSILLPLGWVAGGAVAAAMAIGLLSDGNRGGEVSQGIARVIRIEGEGHANGKRNLGRGSEMFAGDQIVLSEGLIELAFRESGVHLVATAPLAFTAEGDHRIFLYDGEAKLHVPPQGVGFVVETPQRKITDLGTSFVVTAKEKGSRVLVLDGEIMVDEPEGGLGHLMTEGDLADFDQSGTIKLRSRQHTGLPERIESPSLVPDSGLRGSVYAFSEVTQFPEEGGKGDFIGPEFLPLVRSGFVDRSSLQRMNQGSVLRFAGIAGSYGKFPWRNGLPSYSGRGGWLAWYQGTVAPPQAGRYRFWGYADNQLLVALDGEPIFEGSRYDSVFRGELNVPRHDHPGWPCLNALSGFAAGPWIEVGDDPVQIDILFGETGGHLTSAILLIEREGDHYEEAFWGQPKWPLFLTEPPTAEEVIELERLRRHMEEKLMGSFSIEAEAVWPVSK